MKKIEKISESESYSAINLGDLNELMEYSLIHPINKNEIEGKVFIKDAIKSTSTEISFNSLPACTEQPYFHIHNKNEEIYMILKGHGFFQVDEECFEIKEGSIIRVSPKGIRGIKNDSNDKMIYIVIQAKENSLEEYTTTDGKRTSGLGTDNEFKPKWR